MNVIARQRGGQSAASRVHDQLVHGHLAQVHVVLRDECYDAVQQCIGHRLLALLVVGAGVAHSARGALLAAQDHVHQTGLACSAAAQNRCEFAGPDVPADSADAHGLARHQSDVVEGDGHRGGLGQHADEYRVG